MVRPRRLLSVALLLVSIVNMAFPASSQGASRSLGDKVVQVSLPAPTGTTVGGPDSQDAPQVATTVRVQLGGYTVSGHGPPFSRIAVLLKEGGGAIKASTTAVTYAEGTFFTGFLSENHEVVIVLPGNVLELTPDIGQRVSLTVPDITGHADVASDIIKGTAPANSALRVSTNANSFPGTATTVPAIDYRPGPPPPPVGVTTDSQGRYTATFSGIADIRRGNSFTVSFFDASGNEIYFSATIAKLLVTVNSSLVSGFTGSEVSNCSLTLKDATGSVAATAAFPLNTNPPSKQSSYYSQTGGSFSAQFRNQAGVPVPVLPGNTVEMTPQKGESLALNAVELSVTVADLNAMTFGGKGPANSSLTTSVFQKPSIMTDAGGQWTFQPGLAHNRAAGPSFTISYRDTATNEHQLKVEYPLLSVQPMANTIYGVASPSCSVSATLKDPTGAVRSQTTSASNESGRFNASFLRNGNLVPIQPGDTLEVVPQMGKTMTMTVGELTVQGDIPAGAVKGKAPPGAVVQVADGYYARTVTADQQGNYLADFSALGGVKRGDYIYARYYTSQGYMESASLRIPLLSARLNSAYLSGYLAAPAQTAFVLKDASGAVKTSGSMWVGANLFEYYFSDARGNRILIQAGDTVEVTPLNGETLRLVAPELTLRMDPATFAFQGKGPPNSRLEIYGGGYPSPVTTDAQGNYTVAPPTGGLSARSSLQIRYTNPTGDQTDVFIIVPQINIRLHTNQVSGFATDMTDLSLTLRDSSSKMKGTAATRSGSGGFSGGSFNASLVDQNNQAAVVLPGDVIELTPASEWTTTFGIPLISVTWDVVTDVVGGKAPPNSSVDVDVGPYDGPSYYASSNVLRVMTDIAGNYSANFKGKADLKRGIRVRTAWASPAGHTPYLSVIIPGIEAQMNTSRVTGSATDRVPFTLTLKDPAGATRAVESRFASDITSFSADFRDSSFQPVVFQPGWTIELVPKIGAGVIFRVPNVTALPDVITDVVVGSGPPGAKMDVYVEGYLLSTTADSQGLYTADFGGKRDIKRGNLIEARYADPQGNSAYLRYRIPSLDICVNSSSISGYATENTNITLVLKDSSGNELARAVTHAATDGQFHADFVDRNSNFVKPSSGRIVAIAPPGGSHTSIVVPQLTAEVNASSDHVSGKGPPNAPVQVSLPRLGLRGITIDMVTDSAGNYLADFAGRADIGVGTLVRVNYYDPQDNYFYWATSVPYSNPTGLNAKISLTQGVDAQGFGIVKAGINSFTDATTGIDRPVPAGMGAYDAKLSYGLAGLTVLGVDGIGPFSSATAGLNINRDGATMTGFNSFNAQMTGPQAPITLAQLRLRLVGNKDEDWTATLNFVTVASAYGDSIPQKDSAVLSFRRGDANGDGRVDVTDALAIAQYLAGVDPGKTMVSANPVNAASVAHDGASGDKITVSDALAIAQALAGLKDKSFN